MLRLSNKKIYFFFLWACLVSSAFADDRIPPSGSLSLSDLLLRPEVLLLEEQEGDFYYNLGADTQSLPRENVSFYWDAYYHLGSQNDIDYFRNPLRYRHDFVSKVNITRYPILFVNENKEAGLLLGKEVNLWSGIDAFGAIQTNRPPGYLQGGFQTGDALDLPRWLTYYLIFAKKAPQRLTAAMEVAGFPADDHFVIYMMPEHYDWAVGERLPLLPFVLPKKLLEDRGYKIDQLDFSKARVVFPQDSILLFEKSGDFRDLGSAGIHIPIAGSKGEEFFIPISLLDKVYKALHSIFLMSVGLSSPKNFEELQSRVERLTEDLVVESFIDLKEAEEFSSLLSVLLTEAILHPTHIPEESRARSRQMSTRGPFSAAARGSLRAFETSPTVDLVKKTARGAADLIQTTKKILGREPNKSLEADRQEVRELLEGFVSAQSEILQDIQKNGFSIQEAGPWPRPATDLTGVTKEEVPLKKKWLRRLGIGAICAIPFATVATRLLPVIGTEWGSIQPYAVLGGFFGSLSATGFIWYSYLRNVTIRDSRAKGLLYEDNDPRTARLLEEADIQSHHALPQTEEALLEERIQARRQASDDANLLVATWKMSGRMLRNFRDHVKKSSIRAWYGFKSLEDRAKELRENPSSSNEKPALELLGMVMARAYGSVFLNPWHRHAVSLAFPFYFETRERGGRASLQTWQDRGLWPMPYYVGLRAATYGLGFLWSNFKPDKFWEDLDEERSRIISENEIIEPAVSRSVRQLEIAKALELGMDLRLIPAILKVERHLHEEGLAWLERLQNRLPAEFRLSRDKLHQLVEYSDEVASVSLSAMFYSRMRVRLAHLDPQMSLEQKREVLASYAKEHILNELKHVHQDVAVQRGLIENRLHRLKTRIDRYRLFRHETFFRLGKSGENITRAKALLNLGSYPYTHLQDRLIITAQVVPIIASRSLQTDMSEEQLFNGLAPIMLFLGPDNLANYGGGLAISSRMIDSLLEGRLRNERQPYATAIWESLTHAPWQRIFLQSAAMMDLRVLTAVNSSLLMVGILYPIDTALTAWASVSKGTEFVPSLLSKGAGRLANGLAGAGVNVAFSLGSIPFYRTLMVMRRESGGIGSNGYENGFRRNPREFPDRAMFSSAQAALNIGYGMFAGWGVPALSEHFLEWADVNVAQLETSPTGLPADLNVESAAVKTAAQAPILCTEHLRSAIALLNSAH